MNVREKYYDVMVTVQANKLFLHDSEIEIRRGNRTEFLPTVVTLDILNCLVPNSSAIIIGPHGTGKTSLVTFLGRMVAGLSLSDVEETIVRGNPELTEAKVLGTIKPGPLIKDGREEIVWRKFVTSSWKIVDELNRCNPLVQDIIMSLLSEGIVKYLDHVKRPPKYTLFATLNPKDQGTFPLHWPLLDRFGLGIFVDTPGVLDLDFISRREDEKVIAHDEASQIPAILNQSERESAWKDVAQVIVREDAVALSNFITRSFSACTRVRKGFAGDMEIGRGGGICDGCAHDKPGSTCNKTRNGLSVRASKDMVRYSRALAWLLGDDPVETKHVEVIAPWVIWHRLDPVVDEIEREPFYGDPISFATHQLEEVYRRFASYSASRTSLDSYSVGRNSAIGRIRADAVIDPVIDIDLLRYARRLDDDTIAMMKKLKGLHKSGNLSGICQVRRTMVDKFDIPRKQRLLEFIDASIDSMVRETFIITLEGWKTAVTGMSGTIAAGMNRNMRERMGVGTHLFHDRDIKFVVRITGTDAVSPVRVTMAGAGVHDGQIDRIKAILRPSGAKGKRAAVT